MSHLTYCISCWGGVPRYKLSKIFAFQKRCVRLLFGKEWSYDHPEYYESCARVRTFAENMSPKNYPLEHTKPLFNEQAILNVEYLHKYHTFMETFKIMKYQCPVSLFNLFLLNTTMHRNLTLILPSVRLEKTKSNYIFKASTIWNKLLQLILLKCKAENNGIIIPGSSPNSDLTAAVPFVKIRLKSVLLENQSSGSRTQW